MKTDWTPLSLAAFEREIADCFNRGEIKSPVHLAGGNERQLIDTFKDVFEYDWVCCTWRSHYHALLKGVPAMFVRQAIFDGRSIALCFPDHRFISSALVGGIVPIALGLAFAEKRRHPNPFMQARVWCFIGDMAATCGLVNECMRYAEGNQLKMTFVIEDNKKSVATDTMKAWGENNNSTVRVEHYEHDLTWPHVGTGKWVSM